MSATATALDVAFQVTLNVTNLARSLQFYRLLLGSDPINSTDSTARFEVEQPPLVLDLALAPQVSGGTLNHVGVRLVDSAALVDLQRRLEESGFATQRQEGVECCYAQQTKFWATDPDRNLWELYVLEKDIDHSGFEDGPKVPTAAAVIVTWEHRLTEPVPGRITRPDNSVDEVRLEGTFNAQMPADTQSAFLAEARRVLRPGGKIISHCMIAERATEAPALPGLAALVQRVPSIDEMLDAFRHAGFVGMFFETLKDICCLPSGEAALREARLVGWLPADSPNPGTQYVLYKGPLERVTDDDGTVYPRGIKVAVASRAWETLAKGPAAGQFLFFPVA